MELIDEIRKLPAVAYLVAVGIAVIAVAQFTGALADLFDFGKRIYEYTTGLRMPKAKLRESTMETVRNLNNLIADRQPHENKALYSRKLTVQNFQEIKQDTINYAQKTQNLYTRDIAADVEELRFQYGKRGIQHEALENHRKYTINTIGLRKISSALTEVAAEL